MLPAITPEDALLARRCKRLLLEKGEADGTALEERHFEAERKRFFDYVLRRFSGPVHTVEARDLEEAVRETEALLSQPEPPRRLAAPAFRWQEFVARLDLMGYSPKQGGWKIYLIRPSTGVRGSYLDEAAMARLILKRAGIPVVAVKVIFLNKGYVREEELSPEELLRESDLSRRAEKRQRNALTLLTTARALLSGEEKLLPEYRCELPGPCSVCRKEMERLPKHSVLTLARGGKEARQLYARGVDSLLDLPEEYDLSWRQSIQLESVRRNRMHLDRVRLGEFLSRLEYPRGYLDFEAFNSSIPPFPGVSPWAHIPYLFSLHRQDRPGEAVRNETFLMDPGEDQRVAMFRELLRLTGELESLIVFSAPFEAAMIRQLARAANAPESGELLIEKIRDLLEPFNQFVVYHPDQLGKVSMKRIVPIFTEESYEGLEVQDGLVANVAYSDLFFERVPGEERGEVLRRVEEYCKQDTSGMVRLVERLEEMAR
ncbi:MAG: DUF2779 domain-containing protein [Spirochaetaceae bacterium]